MQFTFYCFVLFDCVTTTQSHTDIALDENAEYFWQQNETKSERWDITCGVASTRLASEHICNFFDQRLI